MAYRRRTLEMQADQIESVLARHRVEGRVQGGVVTPRYVQYQVSLQVGCRVKQVKNLAEEIALALGRARGESLSQRFDCQRRSAAISLRACPADPAHESNQPRASVFRRARRGGERHAPAGASAGSGRRPHPHRRHNRVGQDSSGAHAIDVHCNVQSPRRGADIAHRSEGTRLSPFARFSPHRG